MQNSIQKMDIVILVSFEKSILLPAIIMPENMQHIYMYLLRIYYVCIMDFLKPLNVYVMFSEKENKSRYCSRAQQEDESEENSFYALQ